MSTVRSPDGKFPTFPVSLQIDGENPTASFKNAGILGGLIDAVGWLKDRMGAMASILTDGAGGATVEWQAKDENGAGWIQSVSCNGINGLVVTHATFGSVSDYVIEATVARRSDEATLVSYKMFTEIVQDVAALNKTTIRITDDSGASLSVSTLTWRITLRLTKAAAL